MNLSPAAIEAWSVCEYFCELRIYCDQTKVDDCWNSYCFSQWSLVAHLFWSEILCPNCPHLVTANVTYSSFNFWFFFTFPEHCPQWPQENVQYVAVERATQQYRKSNKNLFFSQGLFFIRYGEITTVTLLQYESVKRSCCSLIMRDEEKRNKRHKSMVNRQKRFYISVKVCIYLVWPPLCPCQCWSVPYCQLQLGWSCTSPPPGFPETALPGGLNCSVHPIKKTQALKCL